MLIRLIFVFLFLFTLLLFLPFMAPFLALTLSLMAAATLIGWARETRPHRPSRWGNPSRPWIGESPARREKETSAFEPPRSPRFALAEALMNRSVPWGFLGPAAVGLLGLGFLQLFPSGWSLWAAALGILLASKWAAVAARQKAPRWVDVVNRCRNWGQRPEEPLQTLGPWAAAGVVAIAGITLLQHARDEPRALLTMMVTAMTCLHTLQAAGLRQLPKTRPRSVEKVVEEALLLIAQERGGAFTATDVALATDLTISQAGEILDALHTQGLITMEVQEDGVILYSFPELTYRQRTRPHLSQPVGVPEESTEDRLQL